MIVSQRALAVLSRQYLDCKIIGTKSETARATHVPMPYKTEFTTYVLLPPKGCVDVDFLRYGMPL